MSTGHSEVIRNGDIVSVKIKESNSDSHQNGPARFAVIISADVLNEHLQTVIVCPLIEAHQVTESRVGATLIPKEVIGLDRDIIVFALQIKTIAKTQVIKRISSVPPAYLAQIKESLSAVLDIQARA